MANTYPEKIDLFLVAESLRQERGGKITILGAFSGGRVLLSKGGTFPVALPIAFLIAFNVGKGHFKTRIRITDPNGEPVVEDLPTGDIDKAPEQTMQLMVNFGVFEFSMPGRYRVDSFLDDRVYTEYLNVGVGYQTF